MGTKSEDIKALAGNVAVAKNGVGIYIGIDPGVNTGMAVWHVKQQRFLTVFSTSAVRAEQDVLARYAASKFPAATLKVLVEDTRKLRLPKHLQSPGRTKGAGSVGRDMQRWEEFLTHHQILFEMVGMSPKEFREMDDAAFRAKTGWTERTNEHGRSAAGLVWMK